MDCYLRTLRREWDLTQEDIRSLFTRCSVKRVSRVERGFAPPNAAEILTYSVLFGLPARDLFPNYCDGVDEVIMRGAYKLYESLEGKGGPKAQRKRELLDQLRRRVISSDQWSAV